MSEVRRSADGLPPRREDPRGGRAGWRARRASTATVLGWAVVAPVVVMMVLGAAAVVMVARARSPVGAPRWVSVVLVVLAGVAVLVVAVAGWVAGVVVHRMHDEADSVRAVAEDGRNRLWQLTGRVRAGERPKPPPDPPRQAGKGRGSLAEDVHRLVVAAHQVVCVAAEMSSQTGRGRVEVFVSLGRRMQVLVQREIRELDRLEDEVEDPDLLMGLFTVDHLATCMRREAESLAVLGGGFSARQWSGPVTLAEVLRSAIGEVEEFSRVQMAWPIDGDLDGTVVADVVHLLAHLVENATRFSAKNTEVLLRAEAVTAGVAVEIDDRGTGISGARRTRLNAMLADPSGVDVDEHLKDGRIGLLVVASLAHRHGIAVELRNNIFAGTQAVVVLPERLLADPATTPTSPTVPPAGAGGGETAPATAMSPRPASAGGPPPVGDDNTARSAGEDKPPLPRRRPRTPLPPPAGGELPPGDVACGLDDTAGHDPGLLKAFRDGIGDGTHHQEDER